MPQPPNLTKAELREIRWDRRQQVQLLDKRVPVQFNPETLKVSFSNQKAGGDQRGGSAIQFVGTGTTKLSLQLWFDVTAPLPTGSVDAQGDVRRLTREVAYFIMPREQVGENKYIPPGVRFVWGTFLFDGVMDSMDENLEFFSEDGKPLRASVSINLSRQEIYFKFNEQQAGNTGTPGTRPQQQARAGDTVQKVAARAGRQQDWKSLAADNGIENPRQLAPGTLLNTSSLRR
jgi:Contractile injection system tube protein